MRTLIGGVFNKFYIDLELAERIPDTIIKALSGENADTIQWHKTRP